MKLEFTKMTGAGNDFVVIDNRDGQIKDGAALARQLCDRRWGIGADGLLLLERSTSTDYRMKYFNADGSYGGMCGNGGRCLAYYAYLHGAAASSHAFDALGLVYQAEVRNDIVTLHMQNPQRLKINIMLPLGARRIKAHFIDTGSPHVIISVKEITSRTATFEKINVEKIGRRIRHHKIFAPEGTNVNFVEIVKPSTVFLRTYERGVEAETLACGTGSVAVAVIAYKVWKLSPPITVIPRSKVPLEIDFKAVRGTITGVTLAGPAKVVYTGSIEV